MFVSRGRIRAECVCRNVWRLIWRGRNNPNRPKNTSSRNGHPCLNMQPFLRKFLCREGWINDGHGCIVVLPSVEAAPIWSSGQPYHDHERASSSLLIRSHDALSL